MYDPQDEVPLITLIEAISEMIEEDAPVATLQRTYFVFAQVLGKYMANLVADLYAHADDPVFKQRFQDLRWDYFTLQGKIKGDAVIRALDQGKDGELQDIYDAWMDYTRLCEVFFMKNRALFLDSPDQTLDNSEFDFSQPW